MKHASTVAAELSVPERLLLFCIASGTEWERAGVTRSVITAAIVRGPDSTRSVGQLSLTKGGARRWTRCWATGADVPRFDHPIEPMTLCATLPHGTRQRREAR
jgi:hypothetical protein